MVNPQIIMYLFTHIDILIDDLYGTYTSLVYHWNTSIPYRVVITESSHLQPGPKSLIQQLTSRNNQQSQQKHGDRNMVIVKWPNKGAYEICVFFCFPFYFCFEFFSFFFFGSAVIFLVGQKLVCIRTCPWGSLLFCFWESNEKHQLKLSFCHPPEKKRQQQKNRNWGNSGTPFSKSLEK